MFEAHMSRIPFHTAGNDNDHCAFEWYGVDPAPVRHDDRRGDAAYNEGGYRWVMFPMSATQEGERALHMSSDPLFLLRTKVGEKEDGVSALNVFLFLMPLSLLLKQGLAVPTTAPHANHCRLSPSLLARKKYSIPDRETERQQRVEHWTFGEYSNGEFLFADITRCCGTGTQHDH